MLPVLLFVPLHFEFYAAVYFLVYINLWLGLFNLIPFPSEVIMVFAGFLSVGNVGLFVVYALAGSVGGFVGNLLLSIGYKFALT